MPHLFSSTISLSNESRKLSSGKVASTNEFVVQSFVRPFVRVRVFGLDNFVLTSFLFTISAILEINFLVWVFLSITVEWNLIKFFFTTCTALNGHDRVCFQMCQTNGFRTHRTQLLLLSLTFVSVKWYMHDYLTSKHRIPMHMTLTPIESC